MGRAKGNKGLRKIVGTVQGQGGFAGNSKTARIRQKDLRNHRILTTGVQLTVRIATKTIGCTVKGGARPKADDPTLVTEGKRLSHARQQLSAADFVGVQPSVGDSVSRYQGFDQGNPDLFMASRGSPTDSGDDPRIYGSISGNPDLHLWGP